MLYQQESKLAQAFNWSAREHRVRKNFFFCRQTIKRDIILINLSEVFRAVNVDFDQVCDKLEAMAYVVHIFRQYVPLWLSICKLFNDS